MKNLRKAERLEGNMKNLLERKGGQMMKLGESRKKSERLNI